MNHEEELDLDEDWDCDVCKEEGHVCSHDCDCAECPDSFECGL